MPNVPIIKDPIPTSGGGKGVQLVKVISQAIIQEIVDRTLENAKKTRPPEAGEHPPVPDPEVDEYLCIQATNFNTYAIQDVAAAIDRNTAAMATGFSEMTNAINAHNRTLQAVVDSLEYGIPYVGWTKDTVELFYKQQQQNWDGLYQRLAQMTQEFTGRQVQPLNLEELPFEPVNDLQVDVRIEGMEIEELDHYATIDDPPSQP